MTSPISAPTASSSHAGSGPEESSPAATHAAIDIGTNSFHLVVARGLPDGGFEVVTTEKEMVRLGRGSGEMKQLTDEAIDRGVEALARMVAVAASHRAEVSAVATSAVREAENREVFIDRVRDEIGIEVEVISGFEEARLIHLGVLQALPVFDRRIMLVDIGGGSTEFLIGRGADVIAARSIKLGAIRLTERFFPEGEARPKAVKKCRAYVRNALAAAAHELGEHRRDMAIGSSGTISSVASMISAARGEEFRDLNGVGFDRAELDGLVGRLERSSTAERRGIAGLDARRIDIIVGGALLIQGIFEAFDIEEMTVSGYALREGVLHDRMVGGRGGTGRLTDLRRSNVLRLARQLDPDADHALTAARLALGIFDQTADLHGLDGKARELLEMAAIVHNVGLFVSHAAHHKHTYYIVRHSEQLTGFTERERELLALIARYHRRGLPSDRHAEFAGLTPTDQALVRMLAGMLRIAIGLDRTHQGRVTSLRVDLKYRRNGKGVDGKRGNGKKAEGESGKRRGGKNGKKAEGESGKGAEGENGGKPTRVIITPESGPDVDIGLEIYSARERSELLSISLDLPVEIADPGADLDRSPSDRTGDP